MIEVEKEIMSPKLVLLSIGDSHSSLCVLVRNWSDVTAGRRPRAVQHK
jgi:hypothetical protein